MTRFLFNAEIIKILKYSKCAYHVAAQDDRGIRVAERVLYLLARVAAEHSHRREHRRH